MLVNAVKRLSKVLVLLIPGSYTFDYSIFFRYDVTVFYPRHALLAIAGPWRLFLLFDLSNLQRAGMGTLSSQGDTSRLKGQR